MCNCFYLNPNSKEYEMCPTCKKQYFSRNLYALEMLEKEQIVSNSEILNEPLEYDDRIISVYFIRKCLKDYKCVCGQQIEKGSSYYRIAYINSLRNYYFDCFHLQCIDEASLRSAY